METTLGLIENFNPCQEGWERLVAFIGTDDRSTVVDFKTILKSNGIEDTIWALRTQNYEDCCLFLADVAESVLDIFEKKYPEDLRPRKALAAIRDFKNGGTTKEELKKYANDANDAANDATNDADAASNDAANAYAADVDFTDASNAAVYAAYAAYVDAIVTTADFVFDATDYNEWGLIENLLLKYL